MTVPGVSELRSSLMSSPSSEEPLSEVRGWLRLVGGSVRHGVLDLLDVLHAPSEPLGHRLIRRGSLQLSPKLVVGANHFAHLVAYVDGNTDGSPLVRSRSLYGLTYPPRCIRRVPNAPVGLQLPNRPHKTDVALLYLIFEGQPP